MQTGPVQNLFISLNSNKILWFYPFLQKGFLIRADTGVSIKSFIVNQMDIDETYFNHRIKTIFLDGKPVDDDETAIITDGSILALSAAMPGLVGAVFRKKGVLASFRSSITYDEVTSSFQPGKGMVLLKLFNILIREIGPNFLYKGIFLPVKDFISFLKNPPEQFHANLDTLKFNENEISLNVLLKKISSLNPDELFSLRVVFN